MQIKCPKCATLLKLKSPPASGKIKCPKCAAILKVGGGASAQPSSPSSGPKQSGASQSPAKPVSAQPLPAQPLQPPAQPVQPADPFAQPASDPFAQPAGGSQPGSFDFANLPSAAPTTMPAYQQASSFPAYSAQPAAQNAAPSSDGATSTAGVGASRKTGIIVASVIGVILLLGIIGVGGYLVAGSTSGDSSASAVEKKASPKREPPEGFRLYEVQGVSVFMPRGYKIDPAAGELEYFAVATPLGTVFTVGACEAGDTLSGDALTRKMERITRGEYQTVRSVERNGYKGELGVIKESTQWAPREGARGPMLNVEVFQDDGRLILIGVAQAESSSSNIVVGQSLEPELEEVFFDSFQIGPKPKGGWLF